MKIISYNVNGIRAAMRKGFTDWLQQTKPDIICLQEIKAMKDQVDIAEIEAAGYPYHYWYSADKKGYSGVAILLKKEPSLVLQISRLVFSRIRTYTKTKAHIMCLRK